MENLERIEEQPTELRVQVFLAMVEKTMRKLNLSWMDITKELIGSNCVLCGSRIRKCLNCQQSVSVGTRKCVRCGASLEKVEIEPTYRK